MINAALVEALDLLNVFDMVGYTGLLYSFKSAIKFLV